MPAPENVMAARSSPHAVQVCVDATVGAKAGNPIAVGIKAASAGDTHEHGSDDNLSALVGIAAAASAVTAFAAGAASPAVAFGLLVVLLGGLSLAMASVRGP
uniref:Uncharacterized protein n=1 Tax=Arundo donax TaxID=35708 RepID=A0A0A8Y5D3_ARUDO